MRVEPRRRCAGARAVGCFGGPWRGGAGFFPSGFCSWDGVSRAFRAIAIDKSSNILTLWPCGVLLVVLRPFIDFRFLFFCVGPFCEFLTLPLFFFFFFPFFFCMSQMSRLVLTAGVLHSISKILHSLFYRGSSFHQIPFAKKEECSELSDFLNGKIHENHSVRSPQMS